MPRTVTEYRCLLISPSDVEKERDAVSGVVQNWNAQVGQALGARVDVVRWETHAVPDSTAAPQASLNRQIVDSCDFGIAVFWARLGTATAAQQSGSIEEMKRLGARGRQVMVYFNSAPIPQSMLKDDQFERLRAFKQEQQQNSLLGSYSSLDNLREQVLLHLTATVTRLLEGDRAQPSPAAVTSGIVAAPAPAIATAPIPDVRVEVAAVIAPLFHQFPRLGVRAEEMLGAAVQNHSPGAVYIRSVALALRNGNRMFFSRDAVTGEYATQREVQPGDAFTFHVRVREMLKHAQASDVILAVALDAVGREYKSSHASMRDALDRLAERVRAAD